MTDDKTYSVRLTEREMQVMVNAMTGYVRIATTNKISISPPMAEAFYRIADKLKKAASEKTVVLLEDL